jgi:hypothetical protein
MDRVLFLGNEIIEIADKLIFIMGRTLLFHMGSIQFCRQPKRYAIETIFLLTVHSKARFLIHENARSGIIIWIIMLFSTLTTRLLAGISSFGIKPDH